MKPKTSMFYRPENLIEITDKLIAILYARGIIDKEGVKILQDARKGNGQWDKQRNFLIFPNTIPDVARRLNNMRAHDR
jgi:hypothetical protein